MIRCFGNTTQRARCWVPSTVCTPRSPGRTAASTRSTTPGNIPLATARHTSRGPAGPPRPAPTRSQPRQEVHPPGTSPPPPSLPSPKPRALRVALAAHSPLTRNSHSHSLTIQYSLIHYSLATRCSLTRRFTTTPIPPCAARGSPARRTTTLRPHIHTPAAVWEHPRPPSTQHHATSQTALLEPPGLTPRYSLLAAHPLLTHSLLAIHSLTHTHTLVARLVLTPSLTPSLPHSLLTPSLAAHSLGRFTLLLLLLLCRALRGALPAPSE